MAYNRQRKYKRDYKGDHLAATAAEPAGEEGHSPIRAMPPEEAT